MTTSSGKGTEGRSGSGKQPHRRLCIVDDRQAAEHPFQMEVDPVIRDLPGTLWYEGFNPLAKRLPIGDYSVELEPFGQWFTVEVKTYDDLFQSLRDDASGRVDSRLRHQLAGLLRLKEEGHQVAVMLVGIVLPATSRSKNAGSGQGVSLVKANGQRTTRKWRFNEVVGTTLAIQHLGVMTISCDQIQHAPESLRIAANVVSRQEHFAPGGLPAVAGLAPALSRLVTTFTAVDGIDIGLGTQIANYVHSFPRFWAMSPKELREIPGIGVIMADRLWSHFHSEADAVAANLESKTLEGMEEAVWRKFDA